MYSNTFGIDFMISNPLVDLCISFNLNEMFKTLFQHCVELSRLACSPS